jgi:preprotein translocase subunit SecD
MILFLRNVAIAVTCLTAVGTRDEESKPAEPAGVKVEFRRAETKPAEGLTEVMVAGTTKKLYLHKEAIATNKDMAQARVTSDDQRRPAIEVVFTKDGAKKMAKVFEQHKNKPLAIVVDGKVISAPLLRSAISEKALITGKFSRAEAGKIVKAITGK